MNLVTDGPTALALGVENAEKDVMRRPPRAPDEPLLDRSGVMLVACLGGYIGFATFFIFQTYLGSGDPDQIVRAQTTAFTAIIIMEKFNVFNFRTTREPVWKIGWFSNPWLVLAAAGAIALQILAVYAPPLQAALHTVPLHWGDWGVILCLAAPLIIISEAYRSLLVMKCLQTDDVKQRS